MELKHLHTFLVLSDIKNFTKTADFLHYAQSNVTTQIRQLEEELGVRLFERIGKRITLTAAGVELIPYARQMLNLSEKMKLKFAASNSGRITIGAAESVCITILPEIIKSFQSAHPKAELYLHVLDTSDFAPLLADNTIDLAFTLDQQLNNPYLYSVYQKEEPVCICCTPQHPLAQKPNVSVSDFSDCRFILTGKGCCYRKRFEQDLAEADVVPSIVLETGSLQVIKQVALSGLGLCVLPQGVVQKELDQNELVRISYDTDYHIVSQLIHHKDKWISPNIKDFLETAALWF